MNKTIQALSNVIVLLGVLLFQQVALGDNYNQGLYELNRGKFKAAIDEFAPLLDEGYPPAQFQMGLIYLNGWGVKKEPAKAIEFFNLAAAQDYPDALFELSVIYSEGVLVKKDLKKAFELTKKAADKNLASAQFNLAVMYHTGTGTYIDYRNAAAYYEKAAQQNYALAQFNLALMFSEGKGVDRSTEKSYLWNIVSAKNGYKPAETSRDFDERELSAKQIENIRKKADELYRSLIARAEAIAKAENEKLTF